MKWVDCDKGHEFTLLVWNLTFCEMFLGLLGFHSTAVLVSSAAFLLQRASTDKHLVALVRLVTGGNGIGTSAPQLEQVN